MSHLTQKNRRLWALFYVSVISRERINLRRLEEVDLQERLEVQVGDRVRVLDLQQAGQNAVGDDAALVGGVEARVLLDVVGHELRDLRLGALRARRQLHEAAQLRGEATGLEEGVLRATELPRRLLLRRHVGHILLDTALALGVLDLTGRRLGSEERVGDDLLELVGDAGAHLTQALNHRGDRGRGRGLRRDRHLRGSDRRDNDLRLGSRGLAGGLGGLGLGGRGRGRRRSGGRGRRSGLLGNDLLHGLRGISGAHVYNRGRDLC